MAKGAKKDKEGTMPAEKLPLNFGKRLSHSDKVVRDKGLKILQVWLRKNKGLERLDYLKLWKGLYFGFWMSDKRPVQQELAVNFAMLVNYIPAEKQGTWIDTFWETVSEGWEKLDTHRMSKYLLFVRIVIAEAFKVLKDKGWKEEDCKEFAATATSPIMELGVRGPNITAMGLVMHYCNIFWDELSPQIEEDKAPSIQILLILEPWMKLAELSPCIPLVKAINEGIFQKAHEEYRSAIAASLDAVVAREDVWRGNKEAMRESSLALGGSPVELAPAEPLNEMKYKGFFKKLAQTRMDRQNRKLTKKRERAFLDEVKNGGVEEAPRKVRKAKTLASTKSRLGQIISPGGDAVKMKKTKKRNKVKQRKAEGEDASSKKTRVN